ncbi:MAG: extracellular solute-binding protein [Acetatifactor sp.]
MGKKIGIVGFVFLVCCMVIACGKENQNSAKESTDYHDSWKKLGFRYTEEIDFMGNMTMEYHAEDCKILTDSEPGFLYDKHYAAETYFRQLRYTFHSYLTDAGWYYYLETASPDSGKPSQTEILAGEGMTGAILFADAVKESDIAVLLGVESEEGNVGLFVLHFDEKGTLLSKDEVSKEYSDYFKETCNNWWCDAQGTGYLVYGESRYLTVFDREGRKVYSQECAEQNSVIENAFHTPEGDLIFVQNNPDSGKTDLFWFDPLDKTKKKLATINTPNLHQFTMMNDCNILFSQGGYLFLWNPMTGERRPLFCYLNSNIPGNGFLEYTEYVSADENGKLYLYVQRKTEKQLFTLSNEEQEESDDGIVLVNMVGNRGNIGAGVANYNYLNPEGKIYCKSVNGDTEDEWNRIMADFALGKGPDMMLVWAHDERLEALCQKDILADLEEYLPETVRENIFPGILATGSFDGKLVGLGLDALPVAFMTSDTLWQEDNWTVEDVINLVEQNPKPEGIFISSSWNRTAGVNLGFLAGRHLENSPFIDWKNRKCHFEDLLFIKALKYSKELVGQRHDKSEFPDLLREGEYVAAHEDMYNIWDYVNMTASYGKDCHFIGMAGQKEFSGYWNSVCLILVNKNTRYPGKISDFLQYLVSKEHQKEIVSFFPVNREVIREQFESELMYSRNSMIKSEEDINLLMNGLDSFGPAYHISGNVIYGIIEEEAKGFFDGDKSAEDVAKMVNNRVQLYLDE